jgi:hypothetical protein
MCLIVLRHSFSCSWMRHGGEAADRLMVCRESVIVSPLTATVASPRRCLPATAGALNLRSPRLINQCHAIRCGHVTVAMKTARYLAIAL